MVYHRFLTCLFVASSALVNANRVDVGGNVSNENHRLVGGSSADGKKIPYQLSMETPSGELFCAASVISQDWALTTVSCVKTANVYLGIIRAGSHTVGSGGTTHGISSTLEHPSFTVQYEYDVGLIQVYPKFIFSHSVKAIKLAKSESHVGARASIAGWGYIPASGTFSVNLQTVTVTIKSRFFCSTVVNTIPITTNMVCAGNSTENFCDGDTGIPLVDIATNRQIGIASFSESCNNINAIGVYSNVAAPGIKSWIAKSTGIKIL